MQLSKVFFPALVIAVSLGVYWIDKRTPPARAPTLNSEQQAFLETCEELTRVSQGQIFCDASFAERKLYFVTTPEVWDSTAMALTGALFCTVVDPPGKVIFGLIGGPLQEYLCTHPGLGM